MDKLDMLREFLLESKENGCLSLFLKKENDSDNLKEDLMRLLYNFDDLKIDDFPEKFDSLLNDMDDCMSDSVSLMNILDRINSMLYEIYNIILNRYIPDDFYSELE